MQDDTCNTKDRQKEPTPAHAFAPVCDLSISSSLHRAAFSAAVLGLGVCVCFTGTLPPLAFPPLHPSEARGGNMGWY